MPIKSAPSKLKVVTYLTQLERIEAAAIAKQRQLSLSEWVRQIITHAIESHKESGRPVFLGATPTVEPSSLTQTGPMIFGDNYEPPTED